MKGESRKQKAEGSWRRKNIPRWRGTKGVEKSPPLAGDKGGGRWCGDVVIVGITLVVAQMDKKYNKKMTIFKNPYSQKALLVARGRRIYTFPLFDYYIRIDAPRKTTRFLSRFAPSEWRRRCGYKKRRRRFCLTYCKHFQPPPLLSLSGLRLSFWAKRRISNKSGFCPSFSMLNFTFTILYKLPRLASRDTPSKFEGDYPPHKHSRNACAI